ncbi:hypothetical protein GF352_04355 [archaeon]|nr:hypothetical protein [archaeon]
MTNKGFHVAVVIIMGLIAGLLLYNNLIYVLIFALLSGVTSTFSGFVKKRFFRSKAFFLMLIIILVFIISNPLSGLVFGYVTYLLLDYARPATKTL